MRNTSKPKVMLINWAPIWEGPNVGGGVNLYCREIGLELARRDYRVIYVFSGFTYNLFPFSYVRRHKPWRGIDCFEIINSPSLAPGKDNSGNPRAYLENRSILKQFNKILEIVKPDVVHFNNIEGFCSSCIRLARKQSARVIFSLHNYYTVCPQVFFLFADSEICYDYQDGRRCHYCIPHKSYKAQRIRRGLIGVLAATGNRCERFITEIYHRHRSVIQTFTEGYYSVRRDIERSITESSKGKEIVCGSGQVETQYHHELLKCVDYSGPEEIGKSPGKEPKIHSPYRLRRYAMIESLNKAHVVLAVSKFVAQKFIELGVNPDLVETNHIGSSIGKLVEEYYKTQSAKPIKYSTFPLNFVFIGNAGGYKGLPLLLEALEKLPKDKLAKFKLFIYAQHVDYLLERIETFRLALAGIQIHNGYKFTQLPFILQDKDVGIVPPIWWDPAPQVVMELLANNIPILGAEIGGIPDFIQNGVNGLLFQPGNSRDLAAKISFVLDRPEILNEWRNHLQLIKTVEEHVNELQAFYGF